MSWVRKWVDRQIDLGAGSTLVNELWMEDAQQFKNVIWMSAVQVELLLYIVKHQIIKQDTIFHQLISIQYCVCCSIVNFVNEINNNIRYKSKQNP